MSVGRFHLAQRCTDHKQSMWVTRHELETIDKHIALYYADIFHSSDGVVSQPKRSRFDSGEPVFEGKEVERLLLTSIDQKNRARSFQLGAAAIRQDRNRRGSDR